MAQVWLLPGATAVALVMLETCTGVGIQLQSVPVVVVPLPSSPLSSKPQH